MAGLKEKLWIFFLFHFICIGNLVDSKRSKGKHVFEVDDFLMPLPLPNSREGKYLAALEINSLETNSVLSGVVKRMAHLLRFNGDDPQPLPESRFTIVICGGQTAEVVLDNGLLFGVSDFQVLQESETAGTSKNSNPSKVSGWLEWNRLRAVFNVNVDRMGLRTVGQATAKAGPLLLHINLKRIDENSSPMELSSFEMSNVSDVEVHTKGIDAVCDARKAIENEVQKSVKEAIHNQVRVAIRSKLKSALKITKNVKRKS